MYISGLSTLIFEGKEISEAVTTHAVFFLSLTQDKELSVTSTIRDFRLSIISITESLTPGSVEYS